MTYRKSIPVANEMTRAYWEGAKRHELLIMRCQKCRFWIHPPMLDCPKCQSPEVKPERASGKGTVYSFSIMHNAGNPGFEGELPYAVAIVELIEQKGLFTVSNILDCPAKDVRIGMAVEVVFQDVTPEVTLPQFRRC